MCKVKEAMDQDIDLRSDESFYSHHFLNHQA
jgi:hypothetical protein